MTGWNGQQSNSRRERSRRHQGSESRSRVSQPEWSLAEVLLRLSDILFLLTFAVSLLVFASRTPIGQFCLGVGTLLTVGCWMVSYVLRPAHSWKWTGLEPLFLLGLGLITLQLTPLGPAMRETLSPHLAFIVGADQAGEISAEMGSGFGWDRLSLSPRESRLSLSSILCVMLLFLVQVQRFQDRDHARKLLVGLALATAVFGLFGILQFFAGNGKFFWLLEHPYTNTGNGAKGSFTNPNQFAGFLGLSLGPLLAWTLCQENRTARGHGWQSRPLDQRGEIKLLLGGVALVVVLLGMVTSLSRGGLILAGAGMAITLLCVAGRKLADTRGPLLLLVIVMSALGGVAYLGESYLQDNADELLTGDVEQLDKGGTRRFVWASNLAAQEKFRWVGTGLGSHRDIITAFHAEDTGSHVYTHAENSYLQIGTELGVAGWLLCGMALLLVLSRFAWTFRGSDNSKSDLAMRAGVAGTLGVFLVHGCYDFAWYAPAYMLLLAVYVAYLFAEGDVPRSPARPAISLAPLVLLTGLLTGLGAVGPTVARAARAESPEYRFLLLSHNGGEFDTVEQELQWLKLRMTHLRQALHYDPDNGLNHLRLSGCLRRVFELNMLHGEQTMPVSQVRAAVYQGGFEDAETLRNWLKQPGVMQRAYPMVEAALTASRRALKCSPCYCGAWLAQSDLCFLYSPDPELPDYYLERARRTAPASAEIEFTIGFQAWSRGDIEQALSSWQKVFAANARFQQRILELISPSFTPDDLIALFEPDQAGMFQIMQAYSDPTNPHFAVAALRLAEATLRHTDYPKERLRVNALQKAFNYLAQSQLIPETEAFIAEVTQSVPTSLPLHKSFGTWYYKQKRYAQALPHLEFVLARASQDAHVQKMVRDCQGQQAGTSAAQAGTLKHERFR